MLEFKSGGHPVPAHQVVSDLQQQLLDAAFAEIETKVRGAASSIVDPATGKHADVFVRRKGNDGLVIRTQGSPAFARELERRLGISEGEVEVADDTKLRAPHVYLAHTSEDHDVLAKPLAERLMAEGIEVWLDEWEIRSGDSLRRKMEEGLSNCTHFLVLLTPRSIGKAWVETEIDAGFVRMVEGESRFIGVRVDVEVSKLSPFLRSLRCPRIQLDDDKEVSGLVADIHGVSRKPPRGPVRDM